MREKNPDYISVLGSLDPHKKNVCRLSYHHGDDDYKVIESHVVDKADAKESATKWAEKENLELR